MRIRTKLLIFLLALVLPPLLFVCVYAVRGTQHLGQKLAEGAEEALIGTAKKELVESVGLMRTDMLEHRQVLDRSLALLGREAQHLLAGQSGDAEEVVFDTEPGSRDVLPASLEREGIATAPVIFHVPTGVDRAAIMEDARRLTGLAPLFSTLFGPDSDPGPRGWVRLISGLGCYSAGQHGMPALPSPLGADRDDRIAASGRRLEQILPNPANGRVIVALREPIYRPDGRLAGVVGIDAPLRTMRLDKDLASRFGTQIRVLLLTLRDRPEGGKRLFIVGEREGLGRYLYWKAPAREQWLAPGDSSGAAPMIPDIVAGRSGVQEVDFAGKPVFLAYDPLPRTGLVLAVLAPREMVLDHADQAEDAIMAQTRNILSVTAAVTLAAIGAVVVLVFFGSRAVTRPVAALAAAANRLAGGDLSTSVTTRGRDELSDLSRAFNAMVPQLAERLALKRDMELAREVQQTLLPPAAPALPGLDIAAASVFCDDTGGDYYDFIEPPLAVGSGCDFVIGDATGHGLAAALLISTSRALLRGRAEGQAGPGALLSQTNALLCRDTALTGRFVTLFYLCLEGGGLAPTGSLVWARAGHDPALLFDPEADAFLELAGKGIPLGVDPEYAYADFPREGLRPGQVLVMATDGIWEARSPGGEMFGKKRFMEALRRHADKNAQHIASALLAAVRDFQAGATTEDDMTLVIVKAAAASA